MKAPRFTQLHDWLEWQQTCHKTAIDLGLERVKTVAQRLGLAPQNATIVTVAGTNGKGTCVAALQAMLLARGCRVGSYTSPHISRYNERIQVNGEQAGDADICEAFARIDAARGDITLTYFEFATLAAMVLFSYHQLPFWLLEVGMGGRLDATNIVDADVAVVTSIDLDHTEWLGEDREQIGREKAGICRPGRFLVCADPQPPESVRAVADALGCVAYWFGCDFGFDETVPNCYRLWSQPRSRITDTQSDASPLPTQAYAAHARDLRIDSDLPPHSLAAARQVIALIGADEVAPEVDAKALADLRISGRMEFQRLGTRRVILDVAHNPAAFAYLVERLQKAYPDQHYDLVLAMMADKNISQSVALLDALARTWWCSGLPDNARAAGSAELGQTVGRTVAAPKTVQIVPTVAAALQQLRGCGHESGPCSCPPILITGSFYTVGEARDWLRAVDPGEPSKQEAI